MMVLIGAALRNVRMDAPNFIVSLASEGFVQDEETSSAPMAEKERPAVEILTDDEEPETMEAALEDDIEVQPPTAEPPLQTSEEKPEEPKIDAERKGAPYFSRQYHQFLTVHTFAFAESAGKSILGAVSSEIAGSGRKLIEGSSAQVLLRYEDRGAFIGAEVVSESTELKSLLEQVRWQAVPAPSSFFLGFKGIDVRITIENGSFSVSLGILPI